MVKMLQRSTRKKFKKISAAGLLDRRNKNKKSGVVRIKATFNNTIINLTDLQGNSLFWTSSGSVGFNGSKKKTPFAAQSASEKLANLAYEKGFQEVQVIVSGPGRGRENAIRALQRRGLLISIIKDKTPFPHNGCRPPKKRRL